ncbi:hypothetical protein SK128_000769 [Halocaridina rubra]|uniref:Uncharacterized protein n=1 Tax=Halocaridina rubra TaxID=373956 RepID=A0AAN8XAF4_HALRR
MRENEPLSTNVLALPYQLIHPHTLFPCRYYIAKQWFSTSPWPTDGPWAVLRGARTSKLADPTSRISWFAPGPGTELSR